MSVVAIKKIKTGKYKISADSIMIRGDIQNKNIDAKLWKIDKELIVGSAGALLINRLFRGFVGNHRPKTNDEYGWINLMIEFSKYLKDIDNKLILTESTFIIIYKNKAWELYSFYANEIQDYQAIGAGQQYALAALKLGHSPAVAVEVSCELSIYCEEPIKTLTNY